MADYEDALKLLNEVAQTGEDYETCEEQETVFSMLDDLGMGLDEDHQDLQDLDNNEKVNLFEEAKMAQLQGGFSQEEIDELNEIGADEGVGNLGSLLSDLLAPGGQVIGIGPGETFSMGI